MTGVLLMTACKDSEEKNSLAVEPTELEFAANGSEKQTVVVETDAQNWAVIQDGKDWIMVSETGADRFSVSVKENKSSDERSGEITVTTDHAEPVIVTVTQRGGGIDWATDPALQTLRAFPGAEGYGRNATGGRGGEVVEVTNLLDDPANSPAGSFRWALKQHPGKPITIVFRVSGTIDLKGNNLRSNRSDVTIAGQTAPGDGICIIRGNINLGGSRNLIVRHIRSRVGTKEGVSDPTGAFIAGAALSLENGGNFIIDHCSFSWSAEENIGFYDNDNTTVQWCIISEGLYDAGHGKGARSYGAVVGGKTATYHHNLIAHNVNRSPRYGATTKNDPVMLLDYVNNVHYNWGKANPFYGGDNRQGSAGKFQINIVNNYYRPGPAYDGSRRTKIVVISYGAGQGRDQSFWHIDGNYIEGAANTSINSNNYNTVEIADEFIAMGMTVNDFKSARFSVPYPVETESAHQALNSVLKKAGAFPRDTLDRRIIRETKNGEATFTGRYNTDGKYGYGIIDKPENTEGYPEYKTYNVPADSDHDGIPDAWETANGLNPNDPADGAKTTLTRGTYTNLEVYLYDLVRE